jgi:putative transposase
MTSKTVAQLLADLDISESHSRPSVSNDNPYSEAQFKTLKYRPTFPERFDSLEQARAHSQDFFLWYNSAHYHSGIALLTPETVHYGLAEVTLEARAQTLQAAFLAHPERFKGRLPTPQCLPKAVWINKPAVDPTGEGGKPPTVSS